MLQEIQSVHNQYDNNFVGEEQVHGREHFVAEELKESGTRLDGVR